PGQDWRQHDGLRTAYAQVQAELQGRGRALIRPSGTEPKLRLMVEADDARLADQCARRLADSLA
nr:phosphoglucosamine mutase [Pseudomonas sp.]